MRENETDERVIVIAPVGQDAAAMAALLEANGFHAEICSGAADACRIILSGAGGLLLTEEALEDLKESKEAGFVMHLVKPVNIATLRHTIQILATNRR